MADSPPLHIESGPGGLQLVVGPVDEIGSLFIHSGTDLHSLDSTPHLHFQTPTPLVGELRIPIPPPGPDSPTTLFRAVQWSGVAPILVEIAAGTFLMGTPPSELEQLAGEGPQTEVTLTRSFRMGRGEVTQTEYAAMMGVNPSYFAGVPNRPVDRVTWSQAQEYCGRLTAAQQAAGALPPGWTYRLPTEAEWEDACRAGTTTSFGLGPDLRSGMANFNGRLEYDSDLGTVVNPTGTLLDKTTVAGQYAANAWGLYDMHGNLWEWCLDLWSDRLPGGAVTDPTGPGTGAARVLRGGSWYNSGRICRSGARGPSSLDYKGNDVGFRVVLAPVSASIEETGR